MRLGPLGLPELLIIVVWLAVVVGIIWFIVWAVLSLVRNQRKKREALERIAERFEHRP